MLPPVLPVPHCQKSQQSHAYAYESSHLHALYGEHIGIFDLRTMEMTEGDLPRKAQELVKEWMEQHQKDLLDMWETQNLKKLPPL